MRKLLLACALLIGAVLLNGENHEQTKETLVVLKTSAGEITLKMYPDVAPKAVENFTTHVKNGYYDGIIFHRIIKGFMIQGGDPTGTGMGGESIWGEEFDNEYAPNVVFDKPFLLAMANRGPNTNGSQFFITTAPTPWLNGGYTIFGEVVSGKDVVMKLEDVTTGPSDRPMVDQVIQKALLK
ncbi:MAG TPA: peptidylprolyl isomerase [Epsilonproteobacteria bacterium]|nr:peptidylprolyl isomerase [Campylobacterota bacterium]